MKSIKALIIALLITLFGSMTFAATGEVGVVATGTSTLWSHVVELDNDNNIYLYGRFEGTMYWGNDSITSYGDEDGFLAKADSDGNPLWIKQIGSAQYENIWNGFAIDNEGNSYVGGCFYGITTAWDAHIANITQQQPGSDIVDKAHNFIAKFNTEGTLLWANIDNTNEYTCTRAIDVDPVTDELYAVGYAQGTGTLLGQSIDASEDNFVAKIDKETGDAAWLRVSGGGSGAITPGGIYWWNSYDIEAYNGYVAVVWYSQGGGTGYDGTNTFSTSGWVWPADSYAALLDSSGNEMWIQSSLSPMSDWALAVSIDRDGDVWIGGHYEDVTTANLWGTTVESLSAAYNFYVAELSRIDGSSIQLFTGGQASQGQNQTMYHLSTDQNNQVYIGGGIRGSGAEFFDQQVNPTNDAREGFVYVINQSGAVVASGETATNGHDMILDVEIDDDYNIYIAGRLQSNGLAVYGFDFGSAWSNAGYAIKMPFCEFFNTDVNQEACQSLQDFYAASAGSAWTSNTNWFTKNVCDWNGITCMTNEITEISLANNNINGTIPASLDTLSGTLTQGSFADNDITDIYSVHILESTGFDLGGTSLPAVYIYDEGIETPTIDAGSVITSTKKVRNTTNTTVDDNNLSGNCGRFVAEVDIAAGETTEVDWSLVAFNDLDGCWTIN